MKESLSDDINKLLKWIAKQKVESIGFEPTNEGSQFYTITINDYNIYLEIFYEDKDLLEGTEVVVNVYKNKEVILAYGGTMDDALRKINDLING